MQILYNEKLNKSSSKSNININVKICIKINACVNQDLPIL